jgi:hypothetical protein
MVVVRKSKSHILRKTKTAPSKPDGAVHADPKHIFCFTKADVHRTAAALCSSVLPEG